MCDLYLDWPSRPVRSCIKHFKDNHGCSISHGAVVAWFKENNRCKGVFVSKTCAFSENKHTKDNVMHYGLYKNCIKSIYHNNVTFADEKSFILHDLFKLRVRKYPVNGVAPECLTACGANTRKRYSIMCTIRLFPTQHSRKTIRCVIIEENGTSELFQNHMQFLVQTGFLIRGDAAVRDNAPAHAKGDNNMLSDILTAVGVDAIPLPTCSAELNPIELVFNAMVQRFASACNECKIQNNEQMISLLNNVIDSITPDIIFSCYQKCGCSNFH